MKSFYLLLAIIAVMVSAAPSDNDRRAVLSITNNFDSRQGQKIEVINASFGASRGIYYKGFGLADIYDGGRLPQAVRPATGSNVVAYGDLTRLNDPYPYITSKYAGSKATFSLKSFYVGCYHTNLYGKCSIRLQCYKNGKAVTWSKIAETWIDIHMNQQGHPRMLFVKYGACSNVDSIRFFTYFTGNATGPNLGGATFFDGISYDLYP